MSETRLIESIGQRFHRPPVPSVVACLRLRKPIIFSQVVSDVAMPAPTLAPPIEESFALHVHHTPISKGDIWTSNKHHALPAVREGGIFIFDLQSEPTAQIYEPFCFSRFHIPRAAMDDLAYEQGVRRVTELRADNNEPDPVIQHLASAMASRFDLFGIERDSLFQDSIAIALFSHVAQRYGGVQARARKPGGLAPWQINRLEAWAHTHLSEPAAIADLAALVNVSPSHFARAFVGSFGIPPHRWLVRMRGGRAKALLKGSDTPLSEIAESCGFVDQSHFTRVFTRLEGMTPGQMRRLHRNG